MLLDEPVIIFGSVRPRHTIFLVGARGRHALQRKNWTRLNLPLLSTVFKRPRSSDYDFDPSKFAQLREELLLCSFLLTSVMRLVAAFQHRLPDLLVFCLSFPACLF